MLPRVLAAIPLMTMLAASTPDPALVARMRSFLEGFHRVGAFSGGVLVAQHGRVVFNGAVGLTNLDRKILNTPETVFPNGSLTKPLTAALARKLVDQGKLRLDASLASQLPGCVEHPARSVGLRAGCGGRLSLPRGSGGNLADPDAFSRPRLRPRLVVSVRNTCTIRGISGHHAAGVWGHGSAPRGVTACERTAFAGARGAMPR